MIYIYTDGSTRHNGYVNSNGGFGAVVLREDKLEDMVQEFTQPTTNNREEMKAVLWALENYGKDPLDSATVYSDSRYTVEAFNTWMKSWKDKGWRKANGEIPENLDLIQKYDFLWRQGYRITLKKIQGHAGNQWNELADQLATGKITIMEAANKYGLNQGDETIGYKTI